VHGGFDLDVERAIQSGLHCDGFLCQAPIRPGLAQGRAERHPPSSPKLFGVVHAPNVGSSLRYVCRSVPTFGSTRGLDTANPFDWENHLSTDQNASPALNRPWVRMASTPVRFAGLTAITVVLAACANSPAAISATPTTAPTRDLTSAAKAAATRACTEVVAGARLHDSIMLRTLSGATIPDADFTKLVTTLVAGEQFAVQAAQMDQKWLTLSRAAAGVAGEGTNTGPSAQITAVLNECTAQGLS